MDGAAKTILLTNDDGIDAEGINKLKSVLLPKYNVYVVAPVDQMSATSHSLSLFKPLRARPIDEYNVAIYGSPADCVNFGLLHYLKDKHVDLVISGINDGPNMGDDLHYSGTFAGAAEAALFNVDAISVSVNALLKCDFEPAAQYMLKIVEWLFSKRSMRENNQNKGRGYWGTDAPVLLNVNVPNLPMEFIKGIKWTSCGLRKYDDVIEERADDKGGSEYWIIGNKLSGLLDDGTDMKAVNDGYVSISPIQLDLTDYKILDYLKNEKI